MTDREDYEAMARRARALVARVLRLPTPDNGRGNKGA